MATRTRLSKAGVRQAKAYELFLGLHCRHVDNEYYGEPFLLEDWQRKHLWNPVLGTGRIEHRRFIRRYRRALWGLPRDGGKTEIAAGTLLTIATMEPVHDGEYGVLASSKTQAGKAFRKLKSMIVQDAELHAMWEVLTDTIVHRETGARIIVLPYSEAATQSYHFNVCIIDEYHVHKSPAVLEAVISGQKSITNALCIVITTAGPKREGPLWELIPQWREDPNAYVYWLGANDDDKLEDRNVWRRVKPMSWISLADMEDQFASTSRRAFERYTLNRFPIDGDADKAVTPRQVARCAKQPSQFTFERPFVLGIDGAQSGDAFALIGVQRDGEAWDFREWVFDEPPEDTGFYDLPQIEELIAELYTKGRPMVAIDPARLLLLAQHLDQNYGVPLVAVPQTNKTMCPATALLVNAVKSGTARLGGCPKLAAHVRNAVLLEREPFGERLGSVGKGAAKERIDAAIAAAIGMYALSTQDSGPSVYEERGLLTLSA
jgi:phage terminase large subunit-like protein